MRLSSRNEEQGKRQRGNRRDGKTYEEIGARLGISRNMVKKYLAQALGECRKRVEQDEAG